jgi:hypothetical protein
LTKHLFVLTFILATGVILVTGTSRAQDLPNAPVKQTPAPVNRGAYNSYGQVGLVCGAGASYSYLATKPTVQCGGLVNFAWLELEAGVMGPQASRSSVSGYLTINAWSALKGPRSSKRGVTFITAGYTRLFETGNALDFGGGYALTLDDDHSLRFDVRDYWTAANPNQHNVVLRVAWLVGLPDC